MYKQIILLVLALVFITGAQAQTAQRYDVLITEIMADPTPAQGLPDAEFIELKNVSSKTFDLRNWKISNGRTTATISKSVILKPDSFIVVCGTSAATALSAFGTTIGVSSFPSLGNDGDEIFIRSPQGSVIHTVLYDISWYKNELKADGGWTLEMIDTHNPCSGYNNWTASINDKGGTPGARNSVEGNNVDETPPHIINVYASDTQTVVVVFDEPVDSLPATIINNYVLSEGLIIKDITCNEPSFTKATLHLQSPIEENKIYTITVHNINDCSGNTIVPGNLFKFGLSVAVNNFDIVINEVLSHPKPGGVEYVELYNRSKNIIDLKQLFLANRNSNGDVASIKQLCAESRLFFPGDFIVVSKNSLAVQKQYLVKNPDAMIKLSSMPSYPNTSGTVVLLNKQGNIIDEFQYDEKWHFALINDKTGVAFERIDYNKPTQDTNNWQSAATNAGYGTPTYQNSQFKTNEQAQGNMSVSPKVFSPDGDGYNDFAVVNYEFPESGYVCNITIFDAAGRPVKYLVKNGLCSQSGYYKWDGLDEKNQPLRIGVYVIFTEVFNLQGKVKRYKETVTLARKMR